MAVPVSAEVLAAFRRHDADSSGVLDRGELTILLKLLDAEVWTDEEIDRLLAAAGVDQRGGIDLGGFVSWVWGGKGGEPRPAHHFVVGDGVIYTLSGAKRSEPAVVRFVGELGGKKDLVGLEFLRDGSYGRHDGLSPTLGERGFTCKPGRGTYVSAKNPHLQLAEAQPGDAQRLVSQIGSSLEERMETRCLRQRAQANAVNGVLRSQGQVRPAWVRRWVEDQRRYLFFDRADPSLTGRSTLPAGALADLAPVGGPEMRAAASSSVETEYSGLRLTRIRDGVVTRSETEDVLEHASRHPDEPLHADYLLPLVWRSVDLFSKLPRVPRIPVPAQGRVVVVGDTHGHLKDVIHIFKTHGPPSPANVYLFNGDICDRCDTYDRGGQQGVTIWAIILVYKVFCPESVFFNRGNHEDWYSNDREGPYGDESFHAEIHRKYPSPKDAVALKDAFRELFFTVPLAHIIGKAALVVHGGLWRAGFEQGYQRRRDKPVVLSELEKVSRRVDIPSDAEKRVDMLMKDVLWNDPHNGTGLLANPRGGDTRLFGGDVTESLLAREGLSLLVRSHDWPRTNEPHGFEWWQRQYGRKLKRLDGQDGLCISVFSASDYCGDTGNMGAVAVFTGDASGQALRLAVNEWTADEAMQTWSPPWEATPNEWRLAGSRAYQLWQLRALVVEHKHELFAEFQSEDATKDYHVSAGKWSEVCARILGDFPWEALLGRDPACALAAPAGRGADLVCYTEFLARHQVRYRNTMGRHAGFRRAIACSLFESLMLDDVPLRETVGAIDPNGDGRVSVSELQSALSRVLPSITHEQAWTMLRTTVAGSAQGMVSIHTFLESIQVRFTSTYAKPVPPGAPWVRGALPSIGRDILRHQQERGAGRATAGGVSKLLSGFFAEMDRDQTGFLEAAELAAALAPLPSCAGYSESDLDALVGYCDFCGNGRVNYLEFLHAFRVEPSGDLADELHEDLLEGICRVLYFEYKGPVASALRQCLAPSVERCTPGEFAVALRAVNATRDLLTEDQIGTLVDTLSVDDDGTFDFDDYFASFEIIDTALGASVEDLEAD